MALTDTQARERFGMTLQQAHAIRDLAAQRCDKATLAQARAAWTDMADICRNSQRHPEAIRLRMLSALADGASVADARAVAEAFAACS